MPLRIVRSLTPAIAISLLVIHGGLWTSWSGDLLKGRRWIMIGCLLSLLTGYLIAAGDAHQGELWSPSTRRLWVIFLTLLDLVSAASVVACIIDALNHRDLFVEPSMPRAATVASARFLLARYLRINSLLER